MKLFQNDSGVSGNIGVMLIVCVAVIGVAVVGVSVTSEPTPDAIPNADLIIGCEKGAPSGYIVNLFHNGGDSLIADSLEVYAEYDDGARIRLYSNPDETGGQFCVSNILTYPATKNAPPKRISVLYNGGTSAAALKSLDLGRTLDEDSPIPDSIFVDEVTGGEDEPSGGDDPIEPISGGDVVFARDKGKWVSISGGFSFKVVSPSGSIHVGSDSIPVKAGDVIRITDVSGLPIIIASENTFLTFSMNGKFYLNDPVDDPEKKSKSIVISSPLSFEFQQSSLDLLSSPHNGGKCTLIVVDNICIEFADDIKKTYLFNEIRPSSKGEFYMRLVGNNGDLFSLVGSAAEISQLT